MSVTRKLGPWRDEGNALKERHVRRRGLTAIVCLERWRAGGPWEGWLQPPLGERKPVSQAVHLSAELAKEFLDCAAMLAGWSLDEELAA
jgi:hypothetical protein